MVKISNKSAQNLLKVGMLIMVILLIIPHFVETPDSVKGLLSGFATEILILSIVLRDFKVHSQEDKKLINSFFPN